MAFALSNLDVHYLIKEMRPLLQDAYVDKIYQGKEEKGDFLIRMRSPKTGKQQFYVKAPEALFLTEHRFAWPQQPSGFCMQLRKHLTNAQLLSIEQHGFDRIVELVFRKGDIEWKLVIELFSKGNVVLVNQEGIIRGVMDLQRWKDRTLRVNAPYEYPPAPVDTSLLSTDALLSLFEQEKKELVKFSAISLSLGGKYAEELVARAGLDKKSASLSSEEASRLHASLRELLDGSAEPVINGDDATPFPLRSGGGESQESFSAAIERLIVTEKTDAIDVSATTEVTSRKDKLQRIIDEQTQKVEGYRKSAEENQRRGELVYEKYQELSFLFKELQAMHAKGGWSSVKAYVQEKGLPVTVDGQKGTITLDIKE